MGADLIHEPQTASRESPADWTCWLCVSAWWYELTASTSRRLTSFGRRPARNNDEPERNLNAGTSDDTAIAGEDYLATSGTLIIAAGETDQLISIPILTDSLVEGAERFLVTLSNPGTGAELRTRITPAVQIIEDDAG